MEKLLYAFAMAKEELCKRKPKHKSVLVWAMDGVGDLILGTIVWAVWMCGWPFRTWSHKTTTIAELDAGKGTPYAAEQVIQLIKDKYPGAYVVKVYRYPSYRVGYENWSFRVVDGVHKDRSSKYNVTC